MDTETWVELDDYPGYRVSDLGRVQSCRRRGPGVGRRPDWKDLKPKHHHSGYVHIRVSDGTQTVTTTVHRLVALAFHGPCVGDLRVRHLNGKRDDNRAINLAWGTAKENANDTTNHNAGALGEHATGAKLTAARVVEMRGKAEAVGKGRVVRLAAEYGVSKGLVSRILRGHKWRHVGAASPVYRSAPDPETVAAEVCRRALRRLSPDARHRVLATLLKAEVT